jgi:hypothetical protein
MSHLEDVELAQRLARGDKAALATLEKEIAFEIDAAIKKIDRDRAFVDEIGQQVRLMLVDVATRQTRTLAAGWTSIAGVAWDPGGKAVWFTAARDHALNVLHQVKLDGTLRMVTQTTGRLRLHDVTGDRRAAVTVDAWRLRTVTNAGDRSRSEVSFVSDISADGTHRSGDGRRARLARRLRAPVRVRLARVAGCDRRLDADHAARACSCRSRAWGPDPTRRDRTAPTRTEGGRLRGPAYRWRALRV